MFLKKLIIEYIPTKRNILADKFIKDCGFKIETDTKKFNLKKNLNNKFFYIDLKNFKKIKSRN